MESRANRFAEASGDSSPHQRRRWDCCLSWPAAESGSHGPGRLGGRRGRCFVDAGASALGQLGPPRASASGRLHNSEATSPSSAGASASETRGRLLKGQLERYQLAPPALNVRRAFAAGRRRGRCINLRRSHCVRDGGRKVPRSGTNEGPVPIIGGSHSWRHVLSHRLIDAPSSGRVCATASDRCGSPGRAAGLAVPGERDERLRGRKTTMVTQPEPDEWDLYDLTLDRPRNATSPTPATPTSAPARCSRRCSRSSPSNSPPSALHPRPASGPVTARR